MRANNQLAQAVAVVPVDLVVQRFPGKSGTDAERAVADLEFKLTIGGRVSTGRTGADGTIRIPLPAGGKATLEVMGNTFEISSVSPLEAKDTVHGVQRRLQALGYELGEVDGVAGLGTGTSVLRFQGDDGTLTLSGNVRNLETQEHVKNEHGE